MVYWLVSYPKEGREGSLASRDRRVEGLATDYPFQVPELRVGTLDSLLTLSDELVRGDMFIENVVSKVARLQSELNSVADAKGNRVRVGQDQLATYNGMPFESCLHKFAWDDAKYPCRQALSEIVALIHAATSKTEEELKIKQIDYNAAKSSLSQINRKANGNLLVRSLDEFISPDTVMAESQESESLVTLFVVVNNFDVDSFYKQYENILVGPEGGRGCTWVVPRSAKVLSTDQEYTLISVVVFKKMADDFKATCRTNTPKFTVRDVNFDISPEESNNEKTKLVVEVDKLKSDMQRWCRVNFGEVFLAWLHLKAVRVFVESVLRYGLPVNFQSRLLKVTPKHEKKLRDTLKDVFKHLGSSKNYSDKGEDQSTEFFPYVYLGVNESWTD